MFVFLTIKMVLSVYVNTEIYINTYVRLGETVKIAVGGISMDRKTLLDKGLTEEQVTEILNGFHAEQNALTEQLTKAQKELESKSKEVTELIGYKAEIDEIHKSQMSEAEKIAAQRKEADEYYAKAKITNNTATAKSILASIGITDEGIISTVVDSDEAKTIERANALKIAFQTREEEAAKKAREELSKLDITPPASNTQPGADNAMTWEKYQQLSEEEQSKFATEHPDEFNNL